MHTALMVLRQRVSFRVDIAFPPRSMLS